MEEIGIMCYINGEMRTGSNGLKYDSGPVKCIRVPKRIKYAEFHARLCKSLKVDRRREYRTIICRCPSTINNSTHYSPVAVADDEDLYSMLQHASAQGPGFILEIYLHRHALHDESLSRVQSHDTLDPNPENIFMEETTSRRQYDQLSSHVAGEASASLRPHSPINYSEAPREDIGDGEDILDLNVDPHFNIEVDDDDIIEAPEEDLFAEYVPNPFYTDVNIAGARAVNPVIVPNAQWELHNEFYNGMLFSTKAELKNTIKYWHIMNHVAFIVVESKKDTWDIRCKLHEQRCKWRLRGHFSKRFEKFQITKLDAAHSYVYSGMTQDHYNLDKGIIAEYIKNTINEDPTTPGAVLLTMIKDHFHYSPSLSKIFKAKKKAINLVFGNWEESYNELPRYLNALRVTNPGTRFEWKVNPTNNPGQVIFQRVFWAFGPSIEAFHHCRPVLQIDGTFLCGKYTGKLLVATGVDGNNSLVPVAFAVVEEENTDSWGWFLSLIRMHLTQRVGICLISDRHAGIIAAASDTRNGWTEPYGYHRFCIRHIASNFHKTHKNMKAKNLLIHTASQTQKRKFDKYFKKFVQFDSEYAAWIGRIPLEQWALAHDGGHRFDFMTTNLGECMNNVLKGARQVPITAHLRLTFYRCVKYFVEHRAYINAELGAGNQYTTDTIEKIQNWAERAGGHELRQFHTGLGIIEIKTQFRGWQARKGGNQHTVRLNERTCTCNKPQQYILPCSHVIAACASMHMNYNDFIGEWYKLRNQELVYTPQFNPVMHDDYWPEFQFPHVVPDMSKLRKKGRPKTHRIHNEMDITESSRQLRCGLCRQEEHNRKNCPNITRS
ncbi:Transposon protein, putative, Mutator sub-class [Quillaja saponaria]|uniref:Transposon protein, putative, Mutator sub-class n=1 Tax=Quillaja saponaria TaxID=32244 RepID=A0AAD7Q3Z7_QUISA|nr:Transposon protein, putative, Mutator sub-class [Quillaja saponaria]